MVEQPGALPPHQRQVRPARPRLPFTTFHLSCAVRLHNSPDLCRKTLDVVLQEVGGLHTRGLCRRSIVHHGWADAGATLVGCRGVAALAQLPNLQELRLAGTGAGGFIAGGSFNSDGVLMDVAPRHRIWWMLDG